MILLNANENTRHYVALNPDDWSSFDFNRYPDTTYRSLLTKLTAPYGLTPEEGILTNGSDELIQLLIMAFTGEGQCVVSLEPTFSEYRKLAAALDRPYVGIDPLPNLRFDVDGLLTFLKEQPDALVFLCSPNNPTGESISETDVRRVLSATTNIVALDEAYVEFSDRESLTSLVREEPRLIVLRTLSKAYGLASLRVGYGIAQARTLACIHNRRMPYNVSGLSVFVAEKTVERVDIETVRSMIRDERQRYYEALEELGIDYLPSDANFVMIRPKDPERIARAMHEAGIALRNFKENLLTDRIRITIGSREENDRVLSILKEEIAHA